VYDVAQILATVAPLYDINQQFTAYFQEQLMVGDPAGDVHRYIADRGFSPEMLELFRIGYCPEGALPYEFAVAQGWTEEQVEATGFWRISEDGRCLILKFEHRLMFPFSDIDDTVYGYSGRILTKDTDAHKYVNTANCAVFNKSLMIYGLREALMCNEKIENWVLVEGNADVLSMFQVGVGSAVAVAGTAITEAHLLRLARYSPNFVLMLDNDIAGRNATTKVLQMLRDLHLNFQISILKEVKDPDEAVRLGRPDLIYQALNMKVS
jgi:DNA primase